MNASARLEDKDKILEKNQSDIVRNLEDYWAVAWRRRWWLIVPLFLGWGFVVLAGRFISPRYRSETVIIIEPQASEQYVLSNIRFDVQARLQSITQQILSRTKLLEIASRFHLYQLDQKPTDPDAVAQRMRRDIRIDLIQAPGRPGDLAAFKVSYSAPTAVLAQRVTNELTSLFINENLRNRREASENTTQFLEEQLQTAQQDLSRQDDRLHEYKARHLGELPEQLQNNVQILSGLEMRLQANRDAIDEANQQKLYLESLLAQYQGVRARLKSPSDGAEMSGASLEDQLARLNAQLADLSIRYKPDHPDVRELKDKIATLERLKAQAGAEITPSQTGVETSQAARTPSELRELAPAMQIESQLSASKQKIAHLEQTAKKLDRQIDEYQSRLNVAPLREQELVEINREHEQSRTAYESLLNKKTQSEMATSLEKQRQGELFSVIDPPNLPQRPYWPDRFKLSLLGLIGGTFLALGVTVLAEVMDARIHRDEDLRELLALPVLAGIPMLQTAAVERREKLRRRIEAVAASVSATLIPAITIVTYFRG
jgi:polysaccharide chain length determinant protein (PEP-CTERM system associated)